MPFIYNDPTPRTHTFALDQNNAGLTVKVTFPPPVPPTTDRDPDAKKKAVAKAKAVAQQFVAELERWEKTHP